MQAEIRAALNFLLSYLYDKLPRRRVNLFGDELEKYLRVKLLNAADKESRCLSVNFSSSEDSVDSCLIAAAKESAMDLKEILECLPGRLKLWVEPGHVSYSIQDESNEVKILYNENEANFEEGFENKINKPVLNFKRSAKSQTRPFNNININNTKINGFNLKPNSLNLNLNNLKPTSFSPLSPTIRTNSPLGLNNDISSCSSSSSSSSSSTASTAHSFENQANVDELKPANAKPAAVASLFTTAAFAQTKFGSTKSKNNFTRKNPKMLPNEFSAYIKQKAQLASLNTNLLAPNSLNFNQANSFQPGNVMSYSPLASPQQRQVDLTSNLLNMLKPSGGSGLTTPTDLNNDLFSSNAQHFLNELFMSRIQPAPNNPFSPNLLSPTSMPHQVTNLESLFKPTNNNQLEHGQLQNSYHDHLINSTISELEESLINNYFNHSSFSSSSSSSLSNDNHMDMAAKAGLGGFSGEQPHYFNSAQAQCDESSLIISQIEKLNNLTL